MQRKRHINLKLKASVIESGKTVSQVAEFIDISKSTLSRKINGYIPFTESEIEKVSYFLSKNITDIFFTKELRQTQPEHELQREA